MTRSQLLPPRTTLPLGLHARTKTEKKKILVAFSGIYCVLFCSSIKVLLNKRKTISGTTPLLAVGGVLGILITWVSISLLLYTPLWRRFSLGHSSPLFPRQHAITDGVRTVHAFKHDQVPLGPDLYYANVASALSLIKTSLYLVITVIFDAFIVSFVFNVFLRCQSNSPPLASPMLRGLGPQFPRDSAAVHDLAC